MTDGQKRKVLVVDDEAQVVESIRQLLEDDFEVLTATDPRTALVLLRTEPVTVILSDQRMPALTGDQFFFRAREISEAARILMTGYIDIDALIRAVNKGRIFSYVSKPWDPEELKDIVFQAVAHHELQSGLRPQCHVQAGVLGEKPAPVVLADDDPDDRLLIRRAWEHTGLPNELKTVEDGEELMAYLLQQGRYAEQPAALPELILLDMNMPRKNGFEVLREIRAHPNLRHIPTVIVTTSPSQEVFRFYETGASGFLVKRSLFGSLVESLEVVGRYWLNVVETPPGDSDQRRRS